MAGAVVDACAVPEHLLKVPRHLDHRALGHTQPRMPCVRALPNGIIKSLEALVSEPARGVLGGELHDCFLDMREDVKEGLNSGGDGAGGRVGFVEDGVVEVCDEGEEEVVCWGGLEEFEVVLCDELAHGLGEGVGVYWRWWGGLEGDVRRGWWGAVS